MHPWRNSECVHVFDVLDLSSRSIPRLSPAVPSMVSSAVANGADQQQPIPPLRVGVWISAIPIPKRRSLVSRKPGSLVIAEAAIGQDGHPAAGREDLRQAQTGILDVVTLILQLVFTNRQPQQWHRPTMLGHQIERERCLVVAVEVGPVHGDDDVVARPYQMWDPTREALPEVDAAVAEQAIDLPDRVLGHQVARLGHSGLPVRPSKIQ